MRTSDPNVSLAMVEVAARALDDADPERLSEAELGVEIRALWTATCRLQAQLTRRLAVWHRRGAAGRDGATSTAAWLRHRLRLDDADADRHLAAAAGLDDLPVAARAYADGAISLAHAAAICRATGELSRAVLAGGAEGMLVDRARHEPPGGVRRLVRRLRERFDPAGSAAGQRALREERWLSVERTDDGSVAVCGVLDPASGEALLVALQRVGDGGADERCAAQRRADALVAAIRHHRRTTARADAGVTGAGAERPQVTVTLSLAALRREPGHAAPVLGSGEPVDAAVARRLACDAEIIPAVLGSLSEPLDIGRAAPSVPVGLRRALALRDGGCRFPGCDRPPADCRAHHLRHWADGGQTAPANLVLLCEPHHALVHEDRWRLVQDALTREVRAYRPDGTPLDAVSPPPDRSAWG